MNKWAIAGIIGGLILLVLVFVGVTAAGVAGEASRMDNMLKDDLHSKKTLDDVKKQLADEHYEIAGAGTGPTLEANGPTHSMVVYSTHLTLKVDFTPEGVMTGYHLDRA